MSEAALAYMANLMESLSIPYAFMEWRERPPEGFYFVGEYNEHAMTTMEEDGWQDATFILRGFTRGSRLSLERAKADIKAACPRTAILPNGNGIAVFYENGNPVPTGDAELKSIKINLRIKENEVSV